MSKIGELKKVKSRYQKVCERLELLNEEAFSLEQQILRLSAEIKELK